MKKRMFAIIVTALLAVAMVLSGCAAPSGGSKSGEFAAQDIALTVAGVTVRPNDTVDSLLVALGTGYEYSEAISCTYAMNGVDGADGMDKTFDYGDACIITYPLKPGQDYINSIETYSAQWKTTKGITIGSTLADITAAYGSGYVDNGGIVTYYIDPADSTSAQLYFVMSGDTVECIGFVAGK